MYRPRIRLVATEGLLFFLVSEGTSLQSLSNDVYPVLLKNIIVGCKFVSNDNVMMLGYSNNMERKSLLLILVFLVIFDAAFALPISIPQILAKRKETSFGVLDPLKVILAKWSN